MKIIIIIYLIILLLTMIGGLWNLVDYANWRVDVDERLKKLEENETT